MNDFLTTALPNMKMTIALANYSMQKKIPHSWLLPDYGGLELTITDTEFCENSLLKKAAFRLLQSYYYPYKEREHIVKNMHFVPPSTLLINWAAYVLNSIDHSRFYYNPDQIQNRNCKTMDHLIFLFARHLEETNKLLSRITFHRSGQHYSLEELRQKVMLDICKSNISSIHIFAGLLPFYIRDEPSYSGEYAFLKRDLGTRIGEMLQNIWGR